MRARTAPESSYIAVLLAKSRSPSRSRCHDRQLCCTVQLSGVLDAALQVWLPAHGPDGVQVLQTKVTGTQRDLFRAPDQQGRPTACTLLVSESGCSSLVCRMGFIQ